MGRAPDGVRPCQVPLGPPAWLGSAGRQLPGEGGRTVRGWHGVSGPEELVTVAGWPAFSLGSYSAFPMGPHFLCPALPRPFSAPQLLPPNPPTGAGGRGAEKAGPSPAGVWGLGSLLWLPACLQRAPPPPGPAPRACEKAQDQQGSRPASASLLGLQRSSWPEGGAGRGAFPTCEVRGEPEAWQGRRTRTPALHSYWIVAALLPPDMIILCTF